MADQTTAKSEIARSLYRTELARTEAEIRLIDLAMSDDEDLIQELQRRLAGNREQLSRLEREQLAARRGLAVLDGVAA
jgi:hypothetical protein